MLVLGLFADIVNFCVQYINVDDLMNKMLGGILISVFLTQ